MARLFTLHEAEELLPTLERSLRAAMENKKTVSQLEQQMNGVLARINLYGGMLIDVDQVAALKSGKEQSLERLQRALAEIESSGCLVKDLDIGLLDFPTLLDGGEVYLCWKLGESHIGFWHPTTEGFAGRKAIDRDFLDRHRGEKAQ